MKRIGIMAIMFLVAGFSDAWGQRPEPTFRDVAYGDHQRNKLDFWKANSNQPTPVVVFFHGGGFVGGDKTGIHRWVPVQECLGRGASCISVNYRFLKHTGRDYDQIQQDCEKALDFILEKSKKWNLDESRVAVSGSSAGALITEGLGCRTGKVSVMGVYQQPMGTDTVILKQINESTPPIMIFQPAPLSDRIHSPDYAKMLKATCDQNNVKCVLWGTGKNGIPNSPNGKDPRRLMLDFYFETWETPVK